MNRRITLLTIAAVVSLVTGRDALAADPTTADCLASSDASLRLGNEHKLLAERAQLLVCAAATCPAEIRRECLSRVEEVNSHIPTIVFWAKDASGADLSAVRVTMDGALLTERLEGTALSTDPGEHSFTFETRGLPPVTRSFTILQAQKDRRELILFGTTAAPATTAIAPPLAASSPAASAPGEGLGTSRVLALVAGGGRRRRSRARDRVRRDGALRQERRAEPLPRGELPHGRGGHEVEQRHLHRQRLDGRLHRRRCRAGRGRRALVHGPEPWAGGERSVGRRPWQRPAER